MDIRKLVLASHNKKKIGELSAMLLPLGVELIGMDRFPGAEAPEETGASFEENALIKARYAAAFTGLASLADDSGLAVDRLGGQPGIFSARFAGPDADAAANNRELLRRMSTMPVNERGAAFVCVLALAFPDGRERTWRGEARGVILFEPRGGGGFGYDPLFLSDDLGKTFAEADEAAKNTVSHRARALALFLSFIGAGRREGTIWSP